jgi:hypothetical protein
MRSFVLAARLVVNFSGPGSIPAPPSVADPNPDPDPRVFGPPGSGSIRQRYGSGSESFHHHAKIVRKTLILTAL